MSHQHLIIDTKDQFLESWPSRFKNIFLVLRKKHPQKPDYYDEIVSKLKKHKVKLHEHNISYKYFVFGNPETALRTRYIIGGRRSQAKANADVFKAAHDCDDAVVFLQLPNKKKHDYLNLQHDVVKHFINNLPYKDNTRPNRRYLYGHSTGAWALLTLLKDDVKGSIPKDFKKIRFLNIFLKASIDNNRSLSNIYNWYSKKVANYTYGDVIFDRLYSAYDKFKGEEHLYAPYKREGKLHNAKHHENIYMRPEILRRTALLFSSPFPTAITNAQNIEFFHGTNDRVADKNTALAMSNHIDAPFIEMTGTFHTPYTLPRLKNIFAERVDAMPINQSIKPQRERRQLVARKPSLSGRKLTLSFPSMSRMIRGSMETGQTPLRERPPLPRFLIGR